jgi:hypothetical protein
VRKQEAARSYGVVAASWTIEARAEEWAKVLS